jgi:type IV pilus assembly protein PilW
MTKTPIKTKGFTLIELCVAMALASIVMAALYGMYHTQVRAHSNQNLIVEMQQNARAAMYTMERSIRMAGFNLEDADDTGIVEDFNDAAFGGDFAAHAGEGLRTHDRMITFTLDDDRDGVIDQIPGGDDNISNEIVSFRVNANNLEVWRQNPTSGAMEWAVMANNIEALGFAYALDTDGDGQLDRSPNNNLIWVVDTGPDNGGFHDGDFESYLDRDDDGDIDEQDLDSNGDGNFDNLPSVSDLGYPAGGITPNQGIYDQVRAVRIWLLARTAAPVRGHQDNRSYVVGSRIFTVNDNFQRRLLVSTIQCRNL